MKSRLILAECLIRSEGGVVVLGQSYYQEQPTISNHGLDCATLLAKEKSGKMLARFPDPLAFGKQVGRGTWLTSCVREIPI